MELTRKTFLCTAKQIEMINILKSRHGVKTDTGIFDMALSGLYAKTISKGEDPLSTDEEKIIQTAEKKAKIREVSQSLKDKPKIDRCLNDLKGEIVTNPDGTKVCNYFTHDVNKSYEQSIPLHQCGEYLLDNLFLPDKETVLTARKDLRKKFND